VLDSHEGDQPLENHLKATLAHTTGELLKAKQYVRIAELLHDAQIVYEQMGNAILGDILAAARQICLTCVQYQAEQEWHQRAREEVGRRECELERLLLTILDLIGRGRESEAQQPTTAPIVLANEPHLPGFDTFEVDEHLSLWQRIQGLLGQGGSLWPFDRAVLGISAFAAIPSPASSHEEGGAPSLMVYCLGPFRVYRDDKLITDWPSGKGKAIFKYLLIHRDRPISRDMLMDVFWPDVGPESARNCLNVAIHGLRQALKAAAGVPGIILRDGVYCLSRELRLWVDVDEFRRHVQAGRQLEANGQIEAATTKYKAAASLYQGDFLADDLYEEWTVLVREWVRVAYLDTLDSLSQIYFSQGQYAASAALCQLILVQDNCREDAHCRLMRCYSRQARHHLALRQYQACVEALRVDLGLDPAPSTMQLHERIRRHERV
jgi:DNA-binding SARP family transcriptional activator